MPESVWKAYIDFEIENATQNGGDGKTTKDYSKVRGLYRRLLDITKHVKVWISYTKFE